MLSVGAVFDVTVDMCVNKDIPKCTIYNNNFSTELSEHTITIGNVYRNKNTLDVNNDIDYMINRFSEEYYEYFNTYPDKDKIKDILLESIPEYKSIVVDTNKLVGEYVVIYCNDNNHSVTTKQLNNDGTYNSNGEQISFYKAGNNKNVYKDLKIKRIMKMSFI